MAGSGIKTCAIEGCNARHYARGWCTRHYQRWQRYGTPTGGAPSRQCSAPDCRTWVRSNRTVCYRHSLLTTRPATFPGNPWADQQPCPTCRSGRWTMPYDPSEPDGRWRCVSCHHWFTPVAEAAA